MSEPILVKGTQRVMSTKDPVMAQALNSAVDAIRELQVVVQALHERIERIEQPANDIERLEVSQEPAR